MVEFITELIRQGGYLGIAGLMFLENVFPPIPSELVMPFAGFVAAQDNTSVIGVIVAGTIGSVLGTLFWYCLARLFGEVRLRQLVLRFGRIMTLSQKDIDISKSWFDRYGKYAVFFGRLLPAIRTLISVPAGIVRMRLLPFMLLTTAGSLLWVSFLTILGVILDSQYEKVEVYIDPVSKAILLALILVYVYRFVTYKKEA